MTIETGALEQAYVKKETTYAVVPADALSATDGIRHLELSVTSKKNREASPEKRGTPDQAQSLPRRQTSAFNLASCLWEPSGTIGTPSYVAPLIKGGMGAQHTIGAGLTTTIASGGSATGATLTTGTGLQVGDLVVVTMASGARKEITRLKTVAGNVVTWDTLSGAPDTPGAVVCGTNYSLANNITDSFAIYKYYNAGSFKQAVYGAVVTRIELNFDGTKEVGLAFSGPAGAYGDSSGGSTVQSKPASHTTVGSPASGLVGNLYVDGTAFLVISAKVVIENSLDLRNKELGTSIASGIAGRTAMRKVTFGCTFYLEDTNLLGKANSVTKAAIRLLVGNTNGGMVGCVLPAVEFEIPDIPNDVGPKEVSIEGTAYATAGNDQIFLGEL